MIQALIATVIEIIALLFAMAAGMYLKERSPTKDKPKSEFTIAASIFISLLLAACALGVAAR